MATFSPELVVGETSYGSHEVPLNICDLCIQDHETFEAEAYCTVCVQYLCPACHKAHSRTNVSKTHRTVTGNDMPVKEVRSKIVPTCSKHPGKALVSLCKDHSVACCKVCQVGEHIQCCKRFPFYREYYKHNLIKDTEIKIESLQYLLRAFMTIKQSYKFNLTDIRVKQKEFVAKVNSGRTHTAELENDLLLNKYKALFDAAIDLETRITDLNSLIHELQTKVKGNQDILKKGSDVQIIVVSETMSSEIEKYSAELQESQKTYFKYKTKFSVSETVRVITDDVYSFGEIQLAKVKANFAGDFKERNPVYTGSIDLKSATDTEDVKNIALEILDEGQLLVSDVRNSKVKLYDCTYNIIDEITLTSNPCGMTMLSHKDVTLSLLKEKCLQTVEIVGGTKLQPGNKNRTVLGYCKLVRHDTSLVALAIGDRWHYFDVLDTDGKKIHRIRKESKENGIFRGIMNITMGPHGRVLCVCDIDGCTGMDLNGNVVFWFQDAERKWAWYADVCTFQEGILLVVGKHKDDTCDGIVAVISDKGDKLMPVLQLKNTKPWYMKYNKTGNILLIKPVDENVLKMFVLV